MLYKLNNAASTRGSYVFPSLFQQLSNYDNNGRVWFKVSS